MKAKGWVLGLALLAMTAAPALAAEETAILKVEGMKNCPDCPYIVKGALSRIAGINDIMVSYEEQTCIVAYDDAKTSVAAMKAALAEVGFPSQEIE